MYADQQLFNVFGTVLTACQYWWSNHSAKCEAQNKGFAQCYLDNAVRTALSMTLPTLHVVISI